MFEAVLLARRLSRLSYQPDQGPNVLALYADEHVADIRIRPVLNSLIVRGVLKDYCVADRSLMLKSRKKFSFSHLLAHRNVSTAQIAFLKKHHDAPLIYDIDDLLTSVPKNVLRFAPRQLKRMHWCVGRSDLLTVSTRKLGGHLLEDVGLSREFSVIPNGLDDLCAPDMKPFNNTVIWTSGDVPFFLTHNRKFVDQLAEWANREKIKMVFIGRFDISHIVSRFHHFQHIPFLDFRSYRQFLRQNAGALAIAPLPTQFLEEEQRFFDSKSDIKLLDYLSSGVIPIASSAAPYRDSELFIPELSADTGEQMIALLEECRQNFGRALALFQSKILEQGGLSGRNYNAISMAFDRCLTGQRRPAEL